MASSPRGRAKITSRAEEAPRLSCGEMQPFYPSPKKEQARAAGA